MATIKRWLFQLNLFPQPPLNNAERDAFRERISLVVTRAYLIILTVILLLLTLTFWTPFSVERIDVALPSLDQYEKLPSDATCACTKQSIAYNTFLIDQVSFHQVCSSVFISDQWISSLYFAHNQTMFDNNDFRKIGFSFFQTLSMLCRRSRTHVQDTLSTIYSQSLFSVNLLSPTAFAAQVLADTLHFRAEGAQSFHTRMEAISRLISGSFLLNSLYSSIWPFMIWYFRNSGTVGTRSVHLLQDDGSICYCTASSSCEAPTMKIIASNHSQFNVSFDIPGFRQRCMPVDTSLHSTLECFYNQTCLETLVSSLSITMSPTAMNSSAFSRFENTSQVQEFAKQMMVEDWGLTATYKDYFELCKPKSCSYATITRPSLLRTLGYLIGLLSGLCSGLRILMMILIRLIHRAHSSRATVAGQSTQRGKCSQEVWDPKRIGCVSSIRGEPNVSNLDISTE